jgi:hypothetical protein
MKFDDKNKYSEVKKEIRDYLVKYKEYILNPPYITLDDWFDALRITRTEKDYGIFLHAVVFCIVNGFGLKID